VRQSSMPDIAVFDIAMPDWDGYKTLDTLRHKWPDLKILILTSYKHDYALMRILEGGANGYLQKNTSPEELQQALHAIYQTGLYFAAAPGKLYQRLHNTAGTTALTEREIQLLRLAHTDLTYKEIAGLMHTTERSVAGYRIRLFEKLGVNSRAALVMCGVQMGLIPIA
jgi:two-component system invasion response regulator UvrY